MDAPDCLSDLNLDQVIDAITRTKKEYNLKPFYYETLSDPGTIIYRQEVMQDLEGGLLESITSFAQSMSASRRFLGAIENLAYQYHKEGWFLEAANTYCVAVERLARDLEGAEIHSRGLIAFCEYLSNYTRTGAFQSLLEEAKQLKAGLSSVQYCVTIKGNSVRVRKYDTEIDYSKEVEETFEKFKQAEAEDHRVDLYAGSGMNYVEAQIVDCVAKLYPELFSTLDRFCAKYSSFMEETILTFDREILFYVAYLEYIQTLKRAGLKFCYPQVTRQSKEVYDQEGFDIALAKKLVTERQPVVSNDFYLKGNERIIVVSGPNQGGKTTFARMFGQLHYLASLGCPVPGSEARLFLFDRIFTHFEREEDIKNLRGKLKDDLVRIHEILDQATPDSIIIMNEIFTSTTLKDAVFLSKEILRDILQKDALGICVTFIDELASLSEKTVSMVSTVVPENPAVRTYKIIRKPADGLSYAISIAEKYRLTYASIQERIRP